MYSGQGVVQAALLLIALACVPIMLAGKPYLQYREHKKHKCVRRPRCSSAMPSAARTESRVTRPSAAGRRHVCRTTTMTAI
jgi:hypothetical protein